MFGEQAEEISEVIFHGCDIMGGQENTGYFLWE